MGKLVLSRAEGESVKIGDDIWVTLEWLGSKRARISIEAPKDVMVLRTELLTPRSERQEAGT